MAMRPEGEAVPSPAGPLQAALAKVWAWLPEGRELPYDVWVSRHRTIMWLLGLHVPALFFFGLYMGAPAGQAGLEAGIVGAFAALAGWTRLPRRFRSGVASFGLVSASAVLTNLSGGYIEAHFHFFVMLGIIALYQDWVPFLMSIGYVALHHGTVGTLDPTSVYNHPDAFANPWKWAIIHAAFVLGLSAACVVWWRSVERARSRTDQVLRSAADGVAGLDTSGRITFANEAFSRLTQRRAEDLIGLKIDDVLKGAGASAAQGAVEGTLWPGELTREGDAPLPVEWITSSVLEHGNVVGQVLTLRDVTERRKSEAEIQRTLSLLSATLESTADGILVVDRAGKIARYNRRFVDMWRLPAAIMETRDDNQAIGFVLDQLKDPDQFVSKVRELYANDSAESFDELAFKDGRVFERFSKPQQIAGTPVGRVWSFRDVTERRRAEAERQRQVEVLQEVDRLRELDRFKTSLLNTASHELNTPISALKLQLHMMRGRLPPDLPAKDRRAFEILERSVGRLGTLVRDTLDVARIQSGHLRVRQVPTRIDTLLAETAEAFHELASRSGVELRVENGRHVEAEVDPERITQVLYNLISNAIKFTPRGGTVNVALEGLGDQVRMDVHDSGIGLEPGAIDQLFQPFTQVHDWSSAPRTGAGLGLYISRGIIEQHGGTISCQSEGRNRGSTFSVVVPIKAVEGLNSTPPVFVPDAKGPSPRPGPDSVRLAS